MVGINKTHDMATPRIPSEATRKKSLTEILPAFHNQADGKINETKIQLVLQRNSNLQNSMQIQSMRKFLCGADTCIHPVPPA